MILSLQEIFDLVFMTLVVGYIFMDYFKKPVEIFDPLKPRRFDWENLKFACLITAPAIILHELGHKFTALALGLDATFHAAYTWLGIGVFLKLIGGFIFFVPGYVSMPASSPFNSMITAGAGPLMNLIIFLTAFLVLRFYKSPDPTVFALLVLTKKINLFLFGLNMIPIGMFDGAKVLKGLIQILS